MSLRRRLLVLTILLTTVPVITVTWVATMNTREAVEAELIKSNVSRMLWADQYLDELGSQIESLFYSLQIDPLFVERLSERPSPALGDQLKTALYANSRKVDQVVLYLHHQGLSFTVDSVNSGRTAPLVPTTGPWNRMLRGPINLYFKQEGDEIRAYHGINRFEDRSLMGGLSARIDKGVWREVTRILSEPGTEVVLLNDEGEALAGSSDAQGGPDGQRLAAALDWNRSDLVTGREANLLYFRKRVGSGALALVKVVPLAVVDRKTDAVVVAGLVAGVGFGAISVLLSVLLSLTITRPLVRLTQKMLQGPIRGFEAGPVSGADEVGLLETGYNTMMGRINELIAEEYQKDLDLKNARIQALEAQINPHFLNNALQLMGGMALHRGVPEIHVLARSIGDLLRYSTSPGDTVALADELAHTRNYLHIQESRFQGRCTIVINVEPGLETHPFPKFSLQPLVENAFEHGLQKKEGAWRFELSVLTHRGAIAVLMADNGPGLAADASAEVRQRLRRSTLRPTPKGNSRGIGLANVDARLKLRFGARYGVRFLSRVGMGSLVVLRVPREGGPT